MIVQKKVWDELIKSHKEERKALMEVNEAHRELIESLNATIRDLQGRIAYMRDRAMQKKGLKPTNRRQNLRQEDNREELRTDNREEDNHYHKMSEE